MLSESFYLCVREAEVFFKKKEKKKKCFTFCNQSFLYIYIIICFKYLRVLTSAC